MNIRTSQTQTVVRYLLATFNMNKPLMIGGLLLVIIAVIIFPNTFLNFEIKKSKEIVIAKIIKLPKCNSGSYKHKFFTLEYDGSKTILRTSCKYVSEFHVGQEIKMFHKKGTNNFVFPNEEVEFDLIAILLIGLFGMVIMLIGIKKNK